MDLNKLQDERIFDFVVTVPSVRDKAGESFSEEGLEDAFDLWLMNDSPISLNHSNKIVGKGLRWWKDDYKGHEAYFARGVINKNPLGDAVWDGIQDGKYKDVSFGGFTMDEVVNKDGTTDLNDSYLVEVAVCEEGCHPMSDIVDYNAVAKSKSARFVAKACIIGTNKADKKVPEIGPDPKDVDPGIKVPEETDEKVDGGNSMNKNKEDAPKEEETQEEKPSEGAEEEEKVEGQYVSVEDFNALREQVAAIAEAVAGGVEKSVPGTGEAGGEITPDGTEDETVQDDGGSDPETDEGVAGTVDDEGREDLPATDNRAITKRIEKLVDKAVKKIVVSKGTTPRPSSVAKGSKEPDAYRDVVIAKEPLGAAAFRNKSRDSDEAALKELYRGRH